MSENNSGCTVILIFGGVIILFYVLIKSLPPLINYTAESFVYLGYNLFFYVDNLTAITLFNPILSWGILGIIFGVLFGVIIAVKKYKLSKLLILYPFLFLSLLISILFLINKPTKYSLTTLTSNATQKVITPKKYYYTLNTRSNIRSGPSNSSQVLFLLEKGVSVEFLGRGIFDSGKVEWTRINYNNQEGYIRSKLLNYSYTSE